MYKPSPDQEISMSAANSVIDTIIAKTSEYLTIPSVVGHEGYFMRHLGHDFEALGLTADIHPGLLAVYGASPKSAIVSAHVDRHGLISLGGGEYAYAAQYIKEIKYGQQNRSSQTELLSISSRFEGEQVYAYDPGSGACTGRGVITSCSACMANGDSIFYLHDMPPASPDMPVAYARTAQQEGEYFRGQLDNTISLGVLYALAKAGYQGTILLTAEEEIGKSWAHMAAWFKHCDIDTKELIVIDTSPYNDNALIDGGYITLRNRDKSQAFNPDLVTRFKNRCAALSIPYQVKDEYLLAQGKEIRQLGSTELGRLISETGGEWTGATVQIPTVMYHTSNETTSRASIKNYYEILKNILIDQGI